LRDTYAIKKGAPTYMKEFGYYSLDRWIGEGHIRRQEDLSEICGFDDPGSFSLGNLGGCEAPFEPGFETEILEDRGNHEVVRDSAGRHVLYFKGRRDGFMPEYLDHPVKDRKTWESECKWRMDPHAPRRMENISRTIGEALPAAEKGLMLSQYLVGGYMYLRSLMGPMGLLYKFYDEPSLIHDCMKSWFEVADFVTAKYQEQLTLDEILFDEDICYNHGALISPEMMEEFLLPYYRQLITNIKNRQPDKTRHLYLYIATDGCCPPVIPIYEKIGMDVMGPFEAASNNDVVEIGRQYPNLVISGGMDKRILAAGKDAIDRMIDRIMPVMKERGGYIPTCDHGVPAEVCFEDYVYFRKRLLEFA